MKWAMGALLLVAGLGTASPSRIVLPDQVEPTSVLVTSDGSLWFSARYGGIGRIEPNGKPRMLSTYETTDLVEGPDGAVWYPAGPSIGRISLDEHLSARGSRGDGAHALTVLNGALWYANEGTPDRIQRVTEHGVTSGIALTGARKAFTIEGIAAGPDGALWFTQTGEGKQAADGIGTITTAGHYRSWPLPTRRAAPGRIVAGPDGAVWFTEQHGLGRISTSGAITEFPLRSGLSPSDIVAGSDGSLWFAADSCVGRITTAGTVTAWPVLSGRLLGLAADPHGGLWLADSVDHALRHVDFGEAAPPVTPCGPPGVTRHAGSTSATLSYHRLDVFGNQDRFTDPRLRISRGGRVVFDRAIPGIRESRPFYGMYGYSASFAVRDLDGDGEPEVLFDFDWNGAHCCTWTWVYRFVPARNTYVGRYHFWGDPVPARRDIDGDGTPEFVTDDDRFAYDFDGYAGSVRPIRIWSYNHGVFHNSTSRYPNLVRRDAAGIWSLYVRYRHRSGGGIRGILPAWAADEYMLGRGATVWPALERARAEGYLDPLPDCKDPYDIESPCDPAAYIRAVRALLRKFGYA